MAIFRKAERERESLKMAIAGPAGSGKTHSALKIAEGLAGGGKIFVADTENSRASLETEKSGIPEFFIAPVSPPYKPETFIEIMDHALKEGANVLIIDTLSHEWEGDGGILEQKEALEAARPNVNSWANWARVMPPHNRLRNRILAYPIHLIVTLRTKTDWVVDGKNPVKVGLKPLQREGVEYDFIIVMNLDQESHNARISKDSTSLFDGRGEFTPDQETGERIFEWLNKGAGLSPLEKHEASIQKLERVGAELDKIENLDALTDWFKANEVEIRDTLLPDHWEEFLGRCKELRMSFKSRKWLEWAENTMMKIDNERDLREWRKRNEKNIMVSLAGEDRDQFEQLLDDRRFDLKTKAA